MRQFYSKIKIFVEKHEDRLDTVAFVGGFVFDILTLKMADSLLDNLIVLGYLLIAAVGIITLQFYSGGKLRHNIFERIVLWIPFIIQFSFGGVMSVLVVFYAKSASLISSWPFMLLLIAIFVGNEKFRARYTRLAFQISVLYFLIFLLLIFYVPMIIGQMGSLVFLLSGLLSLTIIALFIKIIEHGRAAHVRHFFSNILIGVGSVYALLNILYFTNIIPPIPLSLREIQVYESVLPNGSGYTALLDPSSDCRFCLRPSVHLPQSSQLFVYSSIFAPTALKTGVIHEWSEYDETSGKWIVRARVPFSIKGGRAEGFRGYTLKSNISRGRWRVKVKTSSGQILGRITFKVLPYDASIEALRRDL